MTIRNHPALLLLLTFAVMLGTDSAAAQDAFRYWSDSWRGWHFYEAPMPEEHEHPLPPSKATSTSRPRSATPRPVVPA